MDLAEAMRVRHSVRAYIEAPLEGTVLETLRAAVEEANDRSGLSLQLVLNEPHAFEGGLARYGKFRGVRNYVACVGPKGPQLQETVGYWGEYLVLLAQTLGLNSCWVGLTYSKRKAAYTVPAGCKNTAVIALGYGQTQGMTRKSKTPAEVARWGEGEAPAWFAAGVQAALLAPTAVNQQRFMLTLEGDRVAARATGGPYSKMDLGIVKRHFEIGSGRDHSVWVAR